MLTSSFVGHDPGRAKTFLHNQDPDRTLRLGVAKGNSQQDLGETLIARNAAPKDNLAQTSPAQ
jgi:hypothetical protein